MRAAREKPRERTCKQCKVKHVPPSNYVRQTFCSLECYSAWRKGQRVTRDCVVCGTPYEGSRSVVNKRYCSHKCWLQEWEPPSTDPVVADKIAVAKTTTGKKLGLRQRQLEKAGFTLKAKGAVACRACGSKKNLNMHHAIPRSMWKAGVVEPLNGLPLCVTCHMGWHHRRITIYRDAFTAEEWACVSSADLLGQVVEAWLDDRYPDRGQPFHKGEQNVPG